ncbi:MAG: DoxX family protein [Verrucomicrobia bacterium]|nr:DoxX family protein [Verrucomicrobiota bacterium]
MMYINQKLNFCVHVYNFFLKIGNNLQSLFLLYMRLTWGHQFFIAGLGKINSIPSVTEYFATLNIPHPALHAYVVGYTELICGFFLFIGFASRIVTVPLILIMLSAISMAHNHIFNGGLFLFDPLSLVREAPYPFLITSLMVFVFGPGRISVDGWIKRWVDNQPRY